MTENVSQRMEVLDIVRGIALIGTLVSHSILFHATTVDIASVDTVIRLLTVLFIDTKFVAIFSFLFGYSSFLFVGKEQKRNIDVTKLYKKRLVILFPIGLIMYMINPYIAPILLLYTVFGMLLIPFFHQSNDRIGVMISTLVLLDGIVVIFMETSFFVHYCLVIFVMMLLGYYVARLEMIKNIVIYKKPLRIITICSSVIGILCTGIAFVHYWEGTLVRYENNFIELGTLAMSILYLTGLFRLFHKRKVRIVASYGRLSLTNYIVQSTVIIVIARIMPPFTQPMATVVTSLLVLLIVVIQMVFSTIWLKYYIYGPVEWVWNWYTYTSAKKTSVTK